MTDPTGTRTTIQSLVSKPEDALSIVCAKRREVKESSLFFTQSTHYWHTIDHSYSRNECHCIVELMTSQTIPRIDLDSDSPGELTTALLDCSCAFLTGHGVADSLRRDIVEVSRSFFDLPVEDKAKVRWPGDGYWRGWQPLVGGQVDIDAPKPTVLERFEVPVPSDAVRLSTGTQGIVANFDLWPQRPAGFAEAWSRYYYALAELSSRVITAISATLSLPPSQLPAWCTHQHANLVANNYLAQEQAPPQGEMRQRPHSDIGGLTVLWADDAPGGLEVRMPGSSRWTPVQFVDGDLLIQPGDLLARWTNTTLRANIHRVVNPPADASKAGRRTSIVYFHYPNLDTVVTPAASCVTSQRSPYPSIHTGEYLWNAIHKPQNRYATVSLEP
ncbi:MAG: isopenicillin N synthase family oxygenase [Gallionella sp.]|nr:isopenicillin N synthase family oxygenase [Gallionella sp.]